MKDLVVEGVVRPIDDVSRKSFLFFFFCAGQLLWRSRPAAHEELYIL